MASLPVSPLFLWISTILFVSLFTPSHSLTCTSQKPASNRVYDNCTDLPSLSAYLHYTYNTTNSSLAIAFMASPAKPDGWVAWGINPTSPVMVGTQALLALKKNGKFTVQTYNISSKRSIEQSKISFDVWDLSAVETGGVITIFATVKLTTGTEHLNQVWQVGPSVTNGTPDVHEFQPANLKATGTLQVVGSTAESNSTGGSGNSTTDGKSGGVSLVGQRFGLGFYFGLFLVMVGFMSL